MRVLHVFKTYLPDNFAGVERVIWSIAEGTHALGVESSVLSISPNPRPSVVSVGHHQSHRSKQNAYIASTGLSFSLLSHFRELAATSDLVHYHFPWPMMDAMHLIAGSKPSVVTYHSDIVRQKGLLPFYRPLMMRFLASVDAVVATSPNYVRSSPVLPRFANKLSVIPIGIDHAVFPSHERVQHWQRYLETPFFLFVGELRYYKGISYLLEAARLCGLPLVVVGAGAQSGHLTDLPENVTYVGAVEEADKLALLRLCTAFVFPSHLRSEAFGVALLEAAREGKAMISCEIGTGTSFVNIDGDTGITVPPADAPALAQAMQMIWQNPERAQAWGERARARFLEHFMAEAMARSYHALYQDVLQRQHPPTSTP